MDINDILSDMKKIEMPDDMQERIIRNCYRAMEEREMNKKSTERKMRKPMAVAVSLAVCGCITGVTALAATGHLQGFFKDKTRLDGAVVGTTYEQATDEINVSVTSSKAGITVTAEFLNPKAAPYGFISEFGITDYTISDTEGNVLIKDGKTAMTAISEGKSEFVIPTDNLEKGDYKLEISQFTGGAKAEQPLPINGHWLCGFTVE